MWKTVGKIILNNRILFFILLMGTTLFMGYRATRVELSYEFAKILPVTDSSYIKYTQFKGLFGEDGNIMILGIQDPRLFKLEVFNKWFGLTNELKNIKGIASVITISNAFTIQKNDSLNKLEFPKIFLNKPTSQSELDSLKTILFNQPFYDGLVFNKKTNAAIMAVVFDKNQLNNKTRIDIVRTITSKAAAFSQQNNIDVHYSGLPYIRTAFTKKVSDETLLFMVLAIIITAVILWSFFRSGFIVLFSIVVVLMGVVWSVGLLEILHYKITILTGLIPPLLIIIGIPNCIFFINSYHKEFLISGNKTASLISMIEKTSLSLLLANVTTAIGFGVLYYTKSPLLVEFGVLAALSVLATFFIALIFIPVIFSLLPQPKKKQIKHLDAKRTNSFIDLVHYLVFYKRKTVYLVILIITLVSFYGMYRIKVIGFVVDDVPKKDPISKDIAFFEKNFKGVLPFEVFIDTKKEKGVLSNNGEVLYKIKTLQKKLAQYEFLSDPVSLVEGLKFAYQGYSGGEKKFYILPGAMELKKLMDYKNTIKGKENNLKAFIDTTYRYTRISFFMADIGSEKLNIFLKEIQPEIDAIFDPAKYQVTLTGHSLMFLEGHDYLLKNLLESLLIEIVLIAIVGFFLFKSVRIILLSKLPCLIPLIITAGIMGFCGIHFNTSTILIFSVAFGISSDGTIYFLTRYRQELKKMKTISEAVSITIRETGISMVYTAVILFAGFSVFAASSFGGTVALGILISITLLVSMCTNLILLPSFLLSLEKKSDEQLQRKID